MEESTSKISSAAVSLIIAVLSGLGVGSGGLLVIWLTMVEGVDAVEARGLNLLFFVFSATSALIFHIGRRRINLKLVAYLALCASVGTVLGSVVGGAIDPSLLKKIFGGMLVLSGIYTLFGKKKRSSGSLDRRASLQ